MSKTSVSKGVSKTLTAIVAVIVIVAVVLTAYIVYLPTTTPTLTTPVSVSTPITKLRKTLVIAIPEEPEGLDIQQVSWANEIHDLIFQPLFTFNEKMELVPDLALNWEVRDNGSVIIVYLPKNAKFSNGDPIKSDFILKSIERYRNLSPYAEDFAVVDRVEIVDDYTAKIILKEPAPYLWAVLTTVYGALVNTDVASKVGPEVFNREPIGSGPYKVKEWVRGSHVTLVRNDFYVTNIPFVKNKGPNPYIDEIIIRFIPEDVTRIAELEAGRVDIVRDVPLADVKRLKENPNIVLYETLSPGIHYIMVNVKKPPLDDVRVRKAIMIAINRDEIAQILENTVLPWYSFLSPSQLCYNESIEKLAEALYSYSIDKAKKLLAEAGWVDTDGDGIVDKDGKPLTLTLLSAVDDPALKKAAPLIQAQLAKIGIKVDIKEYTYDYVRSQTREWNFELALRRFSWADPDILIYLVHSTIGNYTYSNPQVDRLLEEGRVISDFKARTEVYSRAQQILLEDLPLIPLFVVKSYTAVSVNVKGLIIVPPYGSMYFQDVYVEEK